MDVSGGLSSRRRRLWACGSLLIVGAGVVAYRSYSKKEPVAGGSYLTRVRKALREYSEAFLMGSEISSLLLRDLQAFLASDAQDLPQSLKQVLKLAESEVRFSSSPWGLILALSLLESLQRPEMWHLRVCGAVAGSPASHLSCSNSSNKRGDGGISVL